MNKEKFNNAKLEMLIKIINNPKHTVLYTGKGYLVTSNGKDMIFELPVNDANYVPGTITLGNGDRMKLSQTEIQEIKNQMDTRISNDMNKDTDKALVAQLKYLKDYVNE